MHSAIFIAAASAAPAFSWGVDEVFFRLLAVLALVLLNGFFVAAEFAIVKVRGSQLDTLIEQGVRGAARARKVTTHLDEYLSATQLGITLASLGLGWLGEPFLASMIQPLLFKVGINSTAVVHTVAFICAFSIITYMHIVFGELAPKSLAIRKAVQVTLWVSWPLGLFYSLFKPAIWFLNGNANAFLWRVLKIRPVAESELAHSEDELRLILAEGHKSKEASALGNEILINALDLKRRVVRDIMTPRGEVVFLDAEKNFDENVRKAVDSRHARFPLCMGRLDDAVGLVHIKDLLALVRENKHDLMEIKRDLVLVPEMMPLERLLKFFLNKRAHFAVVVDEYGGSVGIVTLDNVLEELVGDIQDEFDAPETEYRKVGDGEFVLEGGLALHDLHDLIGLKAESVEVSTVGGYITHRLGHLPKTGDKIRLDGFELTVTQTDGRRVVSVHAKKLDKGGDEPAAAEAH